MIYYIVEIIIDIERINKGGVTWHYRKKIFIQ